MTTYPPFLLRSRKILAACATRIQHFPAFASESDEIRRNPTKSNEIQRKSREVQRSPEKSREVQDPMRSHADLCEAARNSITSHNGISMAYLWHIYASVTFSETPKLPIFSPHLKVFTPSLLGLLKNPAAIPFTCAVGIVSRNRPLAPSKKKSDKLKQISPYSLVEVEPRVPRVHYSMET